MSGPLTPGTRMNPLSPQDPSSQLSTFRSYVTIIADPNHNVADKKLKAAQELCENFELVVSNPGYGQFINEALKVFMRVLQETEPIFISENPTQQLRKVLLELIHRMPPNEHLRPHVASILALLFKMVEVDCEENVLVCLRIIIELIKQYRPANNPDVLGFLKHVKGVYENLPKHLDKMCENRTQIKVADLSEIDIRLKLEEVFTTTSIITEKKNNENQNVSYNLMPRADRSLKVIAELPIAVVLMYQLYKQQVHSHVADFIPLIMNTINMHPSPQQRNSPYFNHELFVDFIAAQIKTLSFLAYIIRIYQGVIAEYSTQMVKGMLELLNLCPPEVAHLRKELLIAARHILATELKNGFIPYIDKLFDEKTLIGAGWTTHESLRPLAYSTLADLVHHVRQNLPLKDLSLAVHLFSKNVHDDSLPCSIQNMSCKLLLNLVESIKSRSEMENGNGREIFLRMLEVFVLKFQVIAEIQLPVMLQKSKQQESTSKKSSILEPADDKTSKLPGATTTFTPGTTQTPSNSLHDCRVLVKTLVSGVKTITWGLSSCKTPNMDISLVQSKQFLAKEIIVYIRLVKYALVALDIYTINTTPSTAPNKGVQTVRTKEEKEVLEHFAGVFIMMSQLSFKEVFGTMVDYMVNRIHSNYALQVIANSFLASVTTSATFATILVEYLLDHMHQMGSSNVEKSSLHLKLFKLVFGSVSLLANENEQMLKPHLHTIVTRCMEFSRTATDPYNYFLLLRALFRSIGGGSHDLLYQEFLPLLPSLLQGLNSLQGGLHKQLIKDLFVELCLTVPVRLSSLLPYLPLLMDPLVSALNGSHTLISQGLRTLELCVDNLQPDFLFGHIEPVKEGLMQALWHCLSSCQEPTAAVAFRVLGKFGGSSRKMMNAPQKLTCQQFETSGPCILLHFLEMRSPISLPISFIMQMTYDLIKSTAFNMVDTHVINNCWTFTKIYLCSTVTMPTVACKSTIPISTSSSTNTVSVNNDTEMVVDGEDGVNVFIAVKNYLANNDFDIAAGSQHYMVSDEHNRKVHKEALVVMFVCASAKEITTTEIVNFALSITTHYTMVTLLHQCGPQAQENDEEARKTQCLDTYSLIDALVEVLGCEEREWASFAMVNVATILKISIMVLGSPDKISKLPLLDYLSEKVVTMCYERAWYHKMGGCECIRLLFTHTPSSFLLPRITTYLRALIFSIIDLSGEVSYGTLGLAKDAMEELCMKSINMDSDGTVMGEVVRELCRQITTSNQVVREHSMELLRKIAASTEKSVTDLIKPHRDAFFDLITPKKHLLRYHPVPTQIGVMEGNAFCLSLEPRLLTLDLSVAEHGLFFRELTHICEADDSLLVRMHCYKNTTDFVPLRTSAIKVISSCHYLVDKRTAIFKILYNSLNSESPVLQQVAFDCMKKYVSGFQIDFSMVHTTMRPLLQHLSDYSSLTLHRIKVLSSLMQIFPNTFNEKLCEQMLAHLRNWLDFLSKPQLLSQVKINGHVISEELKICSSIIEMFHLIPAASNKMLEPLISLVLDGERDLFIEAHSVFREPLLKFLIRYPEASLEFFFTEARVQDVHCNRLFKWLIEHEDGSCFRTQLLSSINPLLNLVGQENDKQFFGISVIHMLAEHNETWLAAQSPVVVKLLSVWASNSYHERHQNIDLVDHPHWQEPEMLLKILLSFFKQHPNELELLFHMVKCFVGKYLPQFTFFKEFLESTLAKTYSIEWKRNAFFKFVEIFHQSDWSQEIKAKILQHILIPCFTHCTDKEQLIGTPPLPEQESDNNIISIFINKVIDPDNPFGTSDSVRILLLQLSSLFVEKTSKYIHDAANKKQGSKLRRLMTFAWPCLLTKVCVDPATKYHGHLLLSHIIAKFAIHKRIVLQVFHSLLKAHAVEARTVVRQALDVLTPAMPGRMEDDNNMLTHWTRKIIIEDGHTVAQLVHILQLIVRHYKVYYLVRHHLIQNISTSIQRLGLTPTATAEQRKLAVDLTEVMISWEVQRLKEETEEHTRASTSEASKTVERVHYETVVNFLMRIASQTTDVPGTPGDQLSRRCIALFKKALGLWPNADLKLQWFDKMLISVEGQQANINSICTSLELLTYLTTVLAHETILSSFKNLQRGIASCMTSTNIRVIRAVHSLLSHLMSIFPTEATPSGVASKHEELECLYACVSKLVYEGLANYEKVVSGTPPQLFSTLMILKAACQYNTGYIDRLITSFMRVLQKMVKEHLHHTQNSPSSSSSSSSGDIGEMLVLSLELVKNRTGVMNMDMRKAYLGNILAGLIEKSTDVRVIKAVIKILEEWIKNKSPSSVNQLPNLREKTFLLIKLMSNVEKRFPDEVELNCQFLELIHYVYSDETLKMSEFSCKLEQAFLSGLRCNQPHIRLMFFKLFDASVKKRLYDRLVYILCTQNWETIGNHYWIKQCIEFVLYSADFSREVNLSQDSYKLMGVDLKTSEDQEQDPSFQAYLNEEEELSSADMSSESVMKGMGEMGVEVRVGALKKIVKQQCTFIRECKGTRAKSTDLVDSMIQLSHHNTQLSHQMWLSLFPRLWKTLSERMQNTLRTQMVPFLSCGNHLTQRDCQPSSIKTFLQALSLCKPPITVRPLILKYLSKNHNMWHKCLLDLEEQAHSLGMLGGNVLRPHQAGSPSAYITNGVDGGASEKYEAETLDALVELYDWLKEEDMLVGVWMRRFKKPATITALSYEQMGMFQQAQEAYEKLMADARNAFNSSPINNQDIPEHNLWENHWIRCSKELNQWGYLAEYSIGYNSPFLKLESAWRRTNSNWSITSQALQQVENDYPRELLWKMHLYKGYVAVCLLEEQNLPSVEKIVEVASQLVIREWKRLPRIVSAAHVPLLQAAQQLLELQEAASLRNSLQAGSVSREQNAHDIKAIVKTWRNRMPLVTDDLSHWSDIFSWRLQHFNAISSNFEQAASVDNSHSTPPMLGIHHTAVGMVEFAKVARKHLLFNVSLDSLAMVHSMTSIPVVDCYHTMRQHVKCYLQMAGSHGRSDLQEGLDVIESTSFKHFTKEMISESYALKGTLFSQIGKAEDANKCFSVACQMTEHLTKGWMVWGEYLENFFIRDRNMAVGVEAMTCYLQAVKNQSELKCRKVVAKLFWILSFDNQKNLLAECLEKGGASLAAVTWLIWVPQLLNFLVRNEGRLCINILSKVGSIFPQAVYFPTRTMYLTLKIEQRERYKIELTNARLSEAAKTSTASEATLTSQACDAPQDAGTKTDSMGPIKATSSMWRCSRVMHIQRESQTTVLSTLEGIVDQMVWFREDGYEDVLKQLKQALCKCHALAFEARHSVATAQVSNSVLAFIKKLVTTFGVGVETATSSATSGGGGDAPVQLPSAGSESLARRFRITTQDPVFQKIKVKFTNDFDFSIPGSTRLHNMINKLRKWIKILETRLKSMPKNFIIEERCKNLSFFSLSMAGVELPGEFLVPQHNNYYIKVDRFLPRVDIVHKLNTATRRLYIRGHNGKIYPYLVVNDACMTDSRREERVLQLFRIINVFLNKFKETSRRMVNFSVPRIVALSPQLRLIQDNPHSISLFDIYKQKCQRRGVEHDMPITRYFEKLATVQSRGSQTSHQMLCDLFRDIQTNFIPRTYLKEWAIDNYSSATDYWSFRKNVTIHLALHGLVEFSLHLTRLNPDMLYLHQDSGFLHAAHYKFDVDDFSGDLNIIRPVPFRITPNISEFLTTTSILGPFVATMVASARCLVQPKFRLHSFLCALLRDEYMAWYKKEHMQKGDFSENNQHDISAEKLVAMVTKASQAIITKLHSLATFEGAESKITSLVYAAHSVDNLCQMDPSWYPWL